MNNKILKELSNIENYTKEIGMHHDNELFIVDFWTAEINECVKRIREEFI